VCSLHIVDVCRRDLTRNAEGHCVMFSVALCRVSSLRTVKVSTSYHRQRWHGSLSRRMWWHGRAAWYGTTWLRSRHTAAHSLTHDDLHRPGLQLTTIPASHRGERLPAVLPPVHCSVIFCSIFYFNCVYILFNSFPFILCYIVSQVFFYHFVIFSFPSSWLLNFLCIIFQMKIKFCLFISMVYFVLF